MAIFCCTGNTSPSFFIRRAFEMGRTGGSRPAGRLTFYPSGHKKQKGLFSCGGHGIREGRRVLSPGPQLTWQRLRSTERQRPQLNTFRWAELFRRCFVGNAGGENEIFPTAGPGLLPGSRFPSPQQRRCLQRGGSAAGAPPPSARTILADALPVQCANGPKSYRFPVHAIGR